MNYDIIAAMKVKKLRHEVRRILPGYNELTGQTITSKVIRCAPKSRLLYILCRFMAEVDTKVKWKHMIEELEQREKMVMDAINKDMHPPIITPTTVKHRISGHIEFFIDEVE